LKRMVGAGGFEPPTPCAQGKVKNTILLARLALFSVCLHGFA